MERLTWTVAVVGLIFVTLVGICPHAEATVTPTFSHPLDITNPYQPFQVGAVKVYRGSRDGKRDIVVDLFLGTTRTFQLGAATVESRIVQETEFLNGQLIEISRNHLAQADDGSLYYFGEIVDSYQNGVIVDHEGSWLVGGATDPSDPPTTASAPAPTIFMPASPAVGDVFKQEDLFPIVDETDTVEAVGLKLRVDAGTFPNCIQVLETTRLGDKPERKWYAKGIGPIRSRTLRETSMLVASTLLPQ
jgi:hypothetical protein